MALVQDGSQAKKAKVDVDAANRDEEEAPTLEHKVFDITSAIAPVILPIVETLGSLTEEQVSSGGQIGDDD